MNLERLLKAAETRHPAVVLGVCDDAGLGVIRSLSAAGVPLLALDADPGAPGLRSRLCTGRLCPDPGADEEAFAVYLEQLGRMFVRRAVLLPAADSYASALIRVADRLDPWFAAPFSGWDAARRMLKLEAGGAAVPEPAPATDAPAVFVSYLDAQSRPLAQFTGRALPGHPAGSSRAAFVESVWLPEVAEAALRLLREAGHRGMSQAEVRRDAGAGDFVVTGVGPCREPWLSFAAASGVDVALAAYRDAIGEPYLAPRQLAGARSYHGLTAAGLDSVRDPVPAALLAWRRLAAAAGGRRPKPIW